MNVDKIVKSTITNIKGNKRSGSGDLKKLLAKEKYSDLEKDLIFESFRDDIQEIIKEYTNKCPDINKDKGMYKCTLETWQACTDTIGREYFRRNRLLYDSTRSGNVYKDDLLIIAMEVYEYFCKEYRKQFFIYDCALFLGINRDLLYELNNKHTDLLKKAHTMQEASMRAALASGRSNVTAMAILLNHDYNYTRTTEIIHTTDTIKTADTLPILNDKAYSRIEGNNDIM